MSLDAIVAGLAHQLGALDLQNLLVGYSGGLDSTVLLHALSQPACAGNARLRALHVDHGLHPQSSGWAEHCVRVAATFGVPIKVVTVKVLGIDTVGLEAAARTARYNAFSNYMQNGETLCLAHHRDDQTETVLLKLLRGAGPEGLAGMRELRHFGAGRLWRPLLAIPRNLLLDYAQRHDLAYLDDPSNADPRHARNYLRAQVLPLLRKRWPQLDISIGHSARWLGESAQYLYAQARRSLASLQGLDPATLRWRQWLEAPDALRATVLRLWLRDLDLPEPGHLHVAEIQRQLTTADAANHSCVDWSGCELRRYRDLLYAMKPLQQPAPDWSLPWNGSAYVLPAGCGKVQLSGNFSTSSAHALTLRFRRGGEVFRPHGDVHRRELRDLLQRAGIPPWMRPRLPLLYSGTTLLAVADIWTSDAGAAYFSDHAIAFEWAP